MLNRYTQRTQTILDIGCGTGSVDFYLASNHHQVTGIDISKRAIDACKQNAKKLGLVKETTFVQTTVENFRTRKKFDIVICLEVIEHLSNDKKALKKIHALLKKGGLLIMSTPSVNAPLYRIGFLDKFDKRVGHLRRYSMTSITRKVTNAGFKIVESHKTEGIVRNFLYTSTIGGKVLLRLINKFDIARKTASKLDAISLQVFGESDLMLVCKKI